MSTETFKTKGMNNLSSQEYFQYRPTSYFHGFTATLAHSELDIFGRLTVNDVRRAAETRFSCVNTIFTIHFDISGMLFYSNTFK